MFEAPTPDLARRRATLPNVHAVTETQSLDGRNNRLDAWEERPEGDIIPSPEIGVALSSPPFARQSTNTIQEKRRSRSAGNLRDMAKGRPSVERRRSAEIRYWRSSYASASVYSNNTPRPRTAQTIDTVRSVEAHEDLPKLEDMVTKTVSVHAPTIVSQHDQDLSQIQLPVEAFNFGNLRSNFSDDEDSEQPEAPPERRVSIEDRVKHLEKNMRSLDASVRRMSSRNTARQTIILENAPKGRRSRNRSSSASSQRQGSHHASTAANSNALHLRQYEDEQPRPDSPPLSAVNEAPQPQSTVVEMNKHDDSAAVAAHLAALLAQERYARQRLETQVATLQRDLAELHAVVHKFVSTSAASPNYPTPSPDGIITSNEARTPRASEVGYNGRGPGPESVTSSEGDGEEMVSPEDWTTPKESVASGFF